MPELGNEAYIINILSLVHLMLQADGSHDAQNCGRGGLSYRKAA
jgi:hypothetical protein